MYWSDEKIAELEAYLKKRGVVFIKITIGDDIQIAPKNLDWVLKRDSQSLLTLTMGVNQINLQNMAQLKFFRPFKERPAEGSGLVKC